ncbi:MAG: CPA2 family monovalent cation:H+ antiporter-2, partial [Oleiphilaceae bacterium]
AISLCQVGEFSFAIFSLSTQQNILSPELGGFLILVTVLSMIITPFMVNNIYKLASIFVVEFYESDKISPIKDTHHIIICGFSRVGEIAANKLKEQNVHFLIISDNLQHVLSAKKQGYRAYFGHLEKLPVLESLKVEQSASIIMTVNTLMTKKNICQSILKYHPKANLIIKINATDDKHAFEGLTINSFVHAQHETAALLVSKALGQ